ncbi:RNA polymerase sigma factor [Streptomyces sp. NPDC097727]|uniref:RNA polymerase sigma factor n=1 Tax=Streptomyces sp. NPDC097727 TaxID=3366092 RepID=UPI00381DF298
MYDGTAAGESITTDETDHDLSTVFATHSDRLTRWVYNRLGHADWHLAEDIVQETFLRLLEPPYGASLVAWLSDDAVSALRVTAQQVINDHYCWQDAGETPVDFGDWAEAQALPVEAAAEETAVANIVVLEMLAEVPAPLGVAA